MQADRLLIAFSIRDDQFQFRIVVPDCSEDDNGQPRCIDRPRISFVADDIECKWRHIRTVTRAVIAFLGVAAHARTRKMLECDGRGLDCADSRAVNDDFQQIVAGRHDRFTACEDRLQRAVRQRGHHAIEVRWIERRCGHGGHIGARGLIDTDVQRTRVGAEKYRWLVTEFAPPDHESLGSLNRKWLNFVNLRFGNNNR